MFDADRPITKSNQDKLGRATFAKYLARCLLDHKDFESLSVGLYGGWGVGKTSIINLVLEELHFAATNLEDNEKPIILNFSPWSYSGQNQLIYSFFRRLSATMRSVNYLENAERIVYLLELYVSFFTHQPIPKSLQQNKKGWKNIISKKRQEEVFAWESGRDLTLVKAELNALLSQQKHKIIIMIDNISRLYDYEIKQIFQIVKSMGDYVNTVYLLALDKETVIHAINKIDGKGGHEYIEKVIQLPFDIPPIQQYDLEKILADRLSQLIGAIPPESWQTESWANIYYGSLKYLFENCRDITRYINTISFGYSRLKDVVNPIDYFAVTAIEVFMPTVYLGIRENKDLFTDLLDNVYILSENQVDKDKTRCEEILSRNKRIAPNILLDLIMHLFPRIQRIYQPKKEFYHSDAIARKLKRISSPDIFDAYFRLSMQVSEIPETEFQTILALAANATDFSQALTRLNQDERIIKFLDRLDNKHVIDKVPEEHIEAIISALIDNGDLFPQGQTTYFSLNTPMRLHRINHHLLHRVESREVRFSIFKNALTHATKSLYIIIHELNEASREHVSESDMFQPLLFRDFLPDQLESLKKLAILKIKEWGKHGMLADHPNLLPIITAWQTWSEDDACDEYIKQLTANDKGLVAFLIAIFNPAIDEAMSLYQKNKGWEKYLEIMQSFIQPKTLIDHASLLFEDEYFEKLREREQLALLIFLDLMEVPTTKVVRKTSG